MTAQRIVCFGDSIVLGKSQPEGFRWTALMASQINRNFPGRFEVFNRGVGGNTTAQGLARFAVDVDQLLPGLVLIEFGFNDANVPIGSCTNRVGLPEFERNLLEIVRLVRAGKGYPVMLVNHPIPAVRKFGEQGNGKNYGANFLPYQSAIRDVAIKSRSSLIDLEASMRAARVSLKELLSEDNLHLSKKGNAIYARHVWQGLKKLGALLKQS